MAKSKSFRRKARVQPLQRAETLVYHMIHIKLAVAKLETWSWKFQSLSWRMMVGAYDYLGVRIPAFNWQGSRLPKDDLIIVPDELARSFWPSRCSCGVMQRTRGSASFQGILGAKHHLKSSTWVSIQMVNRGMVCRSTHRISSIGSARSGNLLSRTRPCVGNNVCSYRLQSTLRYVFAWDWFWPSRPIEWRGEKPASTHD